MRLLLLIPAIFSLCAFLYAYKMNQEFQKVKTLKSKQPKKIAYQLPQQDVSSTISHFTEKLSYRWSSLSIMLERHELKYGICLRWKGLHKTNRRVLFVLAEEDAQNAFFDGLLAIDENNLLLDEDVSICIPYQNKVVSEAEEEALRFYKNIEVVFRDHSSLNAYPSFQGYQAYIGTGRMPYISYDVKDVTYDYEWTGDLDSTILFEPVITPLNKKQLQIIRKRLSFSNCMKSYFLPVHREWARDIVKAVPESKDWFYPVIEKKDDHITIFCHSLYQLAKSRDIIAKNAKNSHIQIHEVQIFTGMDDNQKNEWFYQRIDHAVRQCIEVEDVIPEDIAQKQLYPYQNVSIFSFSPLLHGYRISTSASSAFYAHLLSDQY